MLQWEHSAILLTVINKLPFVNKIFVLSIFEWPLKTGFTVHGKECFILLVQYHYKGVFVVHRKGPF